MEQFAGTQEYETRLAALSALKQELERADDADYFGVIAKHLPSLLRVQRLSVAIPQDKGMTFEVYSMEGRGGLLPAGSRMLLFGTAIEKAMSEGAVVSTRSEAADTYSDWRHLAHVGLKSFLIVPLEVSEEVIGTLNCGSAEEGFFTDLDEHMGQAMAEVLAPKLARWLEGSQA